MLNKILAIFGYRLVKVGGYTPLGNQNFLTIEVTGAGGSGGVAGSGGGGGGGYVGRSALPAEVPDK